MLNPNYIIGLVDGEGSFTVYIRNPDLKKSVKRRVKVEPRFYLKLIEKDRNILYELKNFFCCGNVYFQRDTRINRQNCYRYEVANRNDLEKIIIPFFKKYKLKLASKRKDFEMLNFVCEKLISLKRLQSVSLILNTGLRIVKSKDIKEKYKIYYIKREIQEHNRYFGILQINIIS